MNTTAVFGQSSEAARRRMLVSRGEPLFLANWDNAVFIHYQADPASLQRVVPFELDLFHGRAFVSMVAFTMRNLRPRVGGKVASLFVKPIATHDFLNVRTYVRHNEEPAIYFMAEWLSNRLSVALGPVTFGLPYRFGRIGYANDPENNQVQGEVSAREGAFEYRGKPAGELQPCEPGSLSEFLLERYTAFTSAGWRRQFFRVWHQPWEQCSLDLEIVGNDLLAATGDWWSTAELVSTNYSPGVSVWMGRPHFA